MATRDRSDCPINLALEVVGDRWSLLILRDIAFAGRRHFRELLTDPTERISSSVLANRLSKLVEAGVLSRDGDPDHQQRIVYSLTEAGVDLIPVMVTLGRWGTTHRSPDPDLVAELEAQLPNELPRSWVRHMAKVRNEHMGSSRRVPNLRSET